MNKNYWNSLRLACAHADGITIALWRGMLCSSPKTILLASLACIAASGCVVAEDASVLSQESASTNALTMNALTMNALTMNALSASEHALDANALNGIVTTAEGRQLLTYVARCALAAGDELVATDAAGEVTHRFHGALGLAPDWLHSPLSESGQRWISACLLAHTNAFGTPVSISARGAHTALATAADERTMFPVVEAAFYGNLFADADGDGAADFVAYACTGERSPHEQDSASLALRICGEPAADGSGLTECGFVHVGACEDGPQLAEYACEAKAGPGGFYTACHSQAGSKQAGWPASSERYDEVVTVYVPLD